MNYIYSQLNYLKSLKNIYSAQLGLKEIIFVLGNPSCDMDSTLSAYLLSIGKNIKENTISIDRINNNISLNKNAEKIYLPVLNCKRGTLYTRLDIKYVFDLNKIEEKDFWYISDEIFSPKKPFEFHKNNNIKTKIILVDHSKLVEDQKYLSEYVVEIYDHHSEKNFNFPNLTSMTLKYPVGSCTTLILLDYFYNNFPNYLVNPLLAVTAILTDTKNFDMTLYKNRWVDLDRNVFNKIVPENIFGEVDNYYNQVDGIKFDEEKNMELGVENLFLKDQKTYNWSGLKIIWCSLIANYYKIQEKFGLNEILSQIYSYYINLTNEEVRSQFFITNSNFNSQKLFTIFNPINIPIDINELRDSLAFTLKNGFVSIKEEKINDHSLKGVVYYIVLNKVYSRKNTEPVLRELFTSLIHADELIP